VDLTLDVVIFGLTAATMVAVGLELEVARIPDLARRKFLLPGMLLGQMLMLPALAILLVRIVPMPEETRLVLLMLAACPTGNVANFFTLLARGNLPLSVSASALSCLLAPIVMPLTFLLYGKLLGGAFPFLISPGTLLNKVLAITWAPIFLGIALRNMRSKHMARFSVLLRNVCSTGVVALCVFICVTRAGQLTTDLKSNLTVSSAFILMTLVAAITTAKTLCLPATYAICYATAFPARNLGVLAVVTVATLHRFDDLLFILVYFVLESLVIFGVVIAYRRRISLQALSA
jgi:bile acid:Na+ symporter, BASS family